MSFGPLSAHHASVTSRSSGRNDAATPRTMASGITSGFLSSSEVMRASTDWAAAAMERKDRSLAMGPG